jgi:hypothetical protein
VLDLLQNPDTPREKICGMECEYDEDLSEAREQAHAL